MAKCNFTCNITAAEILGKLSGGKYFSSHGTAGGGPAGRSGILRQSIHWALGQLIWNTLTPSA